MSSSRCIRRASAIASDVVVPAHSATSAAIRRIWTSCDSSPASFPVPLPEMLSWSEWSSWSWQSLELRLCLSFFASVVLPWLLPLLASRAFGRRGLLAWHWCCCCRPCVGIIWQIEVYSWKRSHQVTENLQWSSSRDWCRFPRIQNHSVQERGIPTLSFHSTFHYTCQSASRSKCSSVLLSRPSQTPSSHADSKVLTSAPGRLHATASPTNKIGFGKTCVESSRMLWLLTLVVCGIACIAMLRVVTTK